MDPYRTLLAKALFPAVEAVRGRPTLPLLRYLHVTERQPTRALEDLQIGLLRRLVRHAQQHTAHYRAAMHDAGLAAEDVRSLADLARLPLLDRDTARDTLIARTSTAPPRTAYTERTGAAGDEVVVRYNAEARHWRDAVRLRAHGWGGYEVGMRVLCYVPGGGDARAEAGVAGAEASWISRGRERLYGAFERRLAVDSGDDDGDALGAAVAKVRAFRPDVIVADAAGALALARFVDGNRLRTWSDTPVLVDGDVPERAAIEQAFGPVFASYRSPETAMVASECEQHDGLHVAMEAVIVEVVVRGADGGVRAALPGEVGELAVTDLHNLACPMIRYLVGQVAVARAAGGHAHPACRCGRGLARIDLADNLADNAERVAVRAARRILST